MIRLTLRLPWPGLLTICVLLSAPVHASPVYIPFREAATGRVLGLTLQDYPQRASAKATAPAPEAIATAAAAFVQSHVAELGVSAAPGDLVALPSEIDKLGLGHQRFALRHGGLPIFGGEVYVHLDGTAGVYYVTTKPMGDPPATLTPSLDAEAARQAARTWATTQAPSEAQIEVDTPELVILPLRHAGRGSSTESRLAWHVRVAAEDPMAFDEQCFVDAGNSEVLFHFSNNRALNRRVYDCSKYPGNPACYIDSPALYYNYWHGRSESAPPRGPDPRVEYPLYFGSTDVDTLHSLLRVTTNYWLTTFGRNGANGMGGLLASPTDQTKAYVHVDNPYPTECPNYAWYASSNSTVAFCRRMITPDILGHEYTHGVDHFLFVDENGTPIGSIGSGETGALEESYADVSAEGVELLATGLHDWHFGLWQSNPPGVYPSCGHGLYRDLAEPTSLADDWAPAAGRAYPDRAYSPNVYCGSEDSGGIHHNSTVPSYAFYLLSEGGEFNGCPITAIGFDAAQQIWYRAWTTYFTLTVTFNEAYFALQQAAADLYPYAVVNEVRIALRAVEMDQPGLCSGIPAQAPVCGTATSVPDDPLSPASGSSIRFCGPNPAVGPATIEYALARGGEVRVAVYDAAGRLVESVVSDRQERGIHQANWVGRRVPSGFYFVRVSLGGETIGTRKLIVIR